MPSPESAENSQVEQVQSEIDSTIEKIEKQEEKVENAATAKEAEKESSKLDALLEKFDALTSRLESIEMKLAEPTVPAPTPKPEMPPVSQVGSEGGVESPKGEEAAPKPKRRLGAW